MDRSSASRRDARCAALLFCVARALATVRLVVPIVVLLGETTAFVVTGLRDGVIRLTATAKSAARG
jgi:hypothetical protein